VGIHGGLWSVEKNLKIVRLLSIIAVCVRKSAMMEQYVSFEFFVTSMPPSKVAMGV